MDGGGFAVSADALIRIFVVVLYLPACLITYRWLFPRLSPTSRRLAGVMLVAQVTVIVVSLGIQSSLSIETWLWDLKSEWNIPATLASTQMALVSGIALVTAWFARARPVWQRLYLVATGLVFMLLALDEYLTLHEVTPNWERNYTVLGAALVAATVLVAVRSPRRAWIWHLCLISGLALSAAGGIFLELLPEIRGNFGLLHLDKSLHSFRWEEFLEFLGIWLALVAMLGQYSDAAPTPQPRVRRLVLAIPLLWILLLLLNSLFPRLELRYIAKPASVAFESGIQLRGYRMEKQEGAFVLRLYASATQRDYLGLGYSVHLVDQVSGDSIASRNEYASRQESVWLFGPDYAPVYRQSTTVMIPPQSPSNRALWVVMSLWRGADDIFVPQKVISSDHQMLNDTQVVLSELVLPENSAASAIVPLAEFDNGFKLAIVNMPDRAQAGEIMSISFDWRSDAGGTEDYVQFLHLGHEDSGEWWAYDQQPLGPRLPTRLWYSGLADCETWEVPLPPDLAPGRYSVLTGLYRLRDKGRLPVVDADGTSFVDARVPLGILTIE